MSGIGSITAVVLAAGEGTRMRSSIPKVLHSAAGRPLLLHVLAALEPLGAERTVIVVSAASGDQIESAVATAGSAQNVTFAVQDPPRGTGDAVRVALAAAGSVEGTLLVLPGDAPLLTTETLTALLAMHDEHDARATVLSARISDPTGYGRVVRAGDGDAIDRIVEDTDADYEQRTIDEINAGVYAFDGPALDQALGGIGADNAQGEYYLTDVVSVLRAADHPVMAYRTHPEEVLGVNSRLQLARVGELLRRQTAERWMDEGVTIIDPNTTYIDATVTIGRDATIHPFTFIEGASSVGDHASIGPNVRIVDSSIAERATVSFAVVIGSQIGVEATVGPFASLRPGTTLGRGARAGTFVETKKTTLGADSKANHLAYLGDAEIGRGVNVGAGTITCNWDGQDKHQTVIEDDAYIGSDTMLVAPTRIGKRAATGAGAVVRGDVPDDALAVGVPARIIADRGDKMGRGAQANDDD